MIDFIKRMGFPEIERERQLCRKKEKKTSRIPRSIYDEVMTWNKRAGVDSESTTTLIYTFPSAFTKSFFLIEIFFLPLSESVVCVNAILIGQTKG